MQAPGGAGGGGDVGTCSWLMHYNMIILIPKKFSGCSLTLSYPQNCTRYLRNGNQSYLMPWLFVNFLSLSGIKKLEKQPLSEAALVCIMQVSSIYISSDGIGINCFLFLL